jgi:hypothetical protein
MGPIVLTLFIGLGLTFGVPPAPVALQTPDLPYVIDFVSTYTELETGEPVRILISVQNRIDSGTDDILRPNPVEIRSPSGHAVIAPTFRTVERNTFEAWVMFQQPGEWHLVLYPDVPESQREWLPTAIPTETLLSVTSGPSDWLGPALIILMAAGLFAYGLDGQRRNGSPRRKLPPLTGGDTWWTGG